MKKVFIIIALASTLGACNNSARQDDIEAAKREAVDSINNVNAIREQAIQEERQREAYNHQHTSSSYSSSGTASAATAPEQKKGMNNAAKGALIGLGTGAVAGALVDKKHGEGAVVGGIIGAGAGAISGAVIDKNKQKKQQQQTNP